MEQFDKIYANQSLNSVIEKQVINLLSKKIESVSPVQTESTEIRKAVWLASILAESENELHLKKVQDLAILLFLNNKNDLEILKVTYILFSRIGNLTATNHLRGLSNSKDENIFLKI